ncbi:uncharacterized protein LOC131243708 isoform X2 [Magnolia sinica]|uniref:uncharacterized protein LOC131243708 isoform X2 n=1 Tax=Magnolia sinica TaxID=86752 RepID=UPI00265ABE2D|nr:uncharacterized protein LOC131243708 isoform X2 [Magnolia sinica]
MGSPFFHEFKKQASFFLKEKIRTARLALTDVTPIELLTEEATDGKPSGPDAQTMGLISRAAFEIDDYWRIVEILHKRLSRFDRKNWRESYKAVILLEHLLTHGPESTATEFQSDRDVIRELGNFQYIDERGFNWGLTVKKKSEWVLQLLEKRQLLKEERDRARKLARGIEGFGSFCQRSTPSVRESCFERCNSHYDDYGRAEGLFSSIDITTKDDKFQQKCKLSSSDTDGQTEDLGTWGSTSTVHIDKNTETIQPPLKENENEQDSTLKSEPHIGSKEDKPRIKFPTEENEIEKDSAEESELLLGFEEDKPRIKFPTEDDHPFSNFEHQTTASLLLMG